MFLSIADIFVMYTFLFLHIQHFEKGVSYHFLACLY